MKRLILAVWSAAATAALTPNGAWGQAKEMVILPTAKQLAKLQAITPEEVARSVTVAGDELDPTTTLTTFNAYTGRGNFTDRVRSDNFLRAFIDKRTHKVIYQFYQTVSYGYAYRNFTSVVFATANGPQSARVIELSHEVVMCSAGLCIYRDSLVFDMSKELVQEIAANYTPGTSQLWRVRFQSQTGFDWEDRISPAEAAGLLVAVETHIKSK